MNMGLSTTPVGFDEIMRAFNKLGFHLNTGETSSTNIKMSKVLKNAICWLEENRSKPWIKIKKKKVT
ncbi:unnamed protein product [marine sediment metagenome]|uniref:Uncharacterized protein n=1 Tax=marine sediment metagenome TaxID=412755 RepID=X1CPF5_9ZZZZ